MIAQPAPDAVEAALAAGRPVLLRAELVGDLETPVAAFLKLRAAHAGTAFLLESVEGGAVRGRYHVLGGTLSPLDGTGPDDLNLATLPGRIGTEGVREVILAVNATVDGQTTAHYVADLLAGLGVKTTRLAHGVPVGGELDYLDDGTLAAALRQRTTF